MKIQMRPLTTCEWPFASQSPNDIEAKSGFAGLYTISFKPHDTVLLWRECPHFQARREHNDEDPDFGERFFKCRDSAVSELLCNRLVNRESMEAICCKYPKAKIDGSETEYGFFVEILDEEAEYVFLLRCAPFGEQDSLSLYVYQKDRFLSFLKRASKGVRFINSCYTTLFTVPDNGAVVVETPDGTVLRYRCRYIDETHFYLVNWESPVNRYVYHICQFAEWIERRKCIVRPANFKE